jgi:hypothetical protein
VALDYRIEIPPGGFVTLGGELRRLAENLAKDVSDRAAMRLKSQIRQDMAGAGLGRLGMAITHTSDKARGGQMYRRGGISRASGIVYIRTRNPRSVGAIISYTEGATMTARNSSGFMWFPLDSAFRLARLPIPRVGKGRATIGVRLTPAWWRRTMGPKLGPLIRIKGADGLPILGVRNVGVSVVGARGGKPRGLTKSGRARRGDRVAEFVPVFKGIRSTSRKARVNVRQRAFQAAQQAAAELRGV